VKRAAARKGVKTMIILYIIGLLWIVSQIFAIIAVTFCKIFDYIEDKF
jgi:hypothetical protein